MMEYFIKVNIAVALFYCFYQVMLRRSILKGLGKGCDEEALRVIKTLPRWEAGEQNGVKVAVYYVQPVVLRVN